MSDETPVPTLCDVCTQTDPDPKIHALIPLEITDEHGRKVTIAEPSYHFDCSPQNVRDIFDADPEAHAVTIAAIEQAESGVKGDDLRTFIQNEPTDNDVTNQRSADALADSEV